MRHAFASPRATRLPDQRRAGFALAEVVVAVSLLAVGLLAVAGVASGILRAESSARLAADATTVLAERLERVTGSACPDSAGVRSLRVVEERWRTALRDSTCWLADTVRYVEPASDAHVVGLSVPVWSGP